MHDIDGLVKDIEEYTLQRKSENKRILATSSFQTQSVVLLHILSNIDADLPIYFINTGYHFPETIDYKNKLTRLFGLNVIDLFPSIPKSEQKNSKGKLLYASDPDRCCYYNKVQPLEAILNKFDIWISGIRSDQTKIRKYMEKEMEGSKGVVRYHPMLHWTGELIEKYIQKYNLPQHPLAPLKENGRLSIGCEPCTKLKVKLTGKYSREERWAGLKKTECGLHTELVNTK